MDNESTSILTTFPTLPASDVVTICEQNGQLVTGVTEGPAGSKVSVITVLNLFFDTLAN